MPKSRRRKTQAPRPSAAPPAAPASPVAEPAAPAAPVAEPAAGSSLADMPAEAIRNLPYNDLVALASESDLPTGGKRPELINRILAVSTGVARYRHGETPCTVCGAPAKVIGTIRQDRPDGSILVTRQMRCTGPNAHTMPIKTIEPAP